MCGLVGVYGDVNFKAKKAFYLLHYLDALRGRDGAGLYWHNKEGEGNILKVDSLPDDLLYMHSEEFNNFEPVLNRQNLDLIMGHNRAATKGAINDKNAHPFEFDRIVGAHNGTLKDYSLRTFPGYGDHEVDSHVMFKGLNEMTKGGCNILPDFETFVNKVDGAIAMTWFDKEKGELNFYRNEQRPLWFVFNKAKTQMFWASEIWMLLVALKRAKILLGKDPQEYPANVKSVVRCVKEKTTTKLISVSQKEFKKVYWQKATASSYSQKVRNWWQNGTSYKPVPPTPPSLNTKKFRVFNKTWTEGEFKVVVEDGCAICGTNLYYAERMNIKFLDVDTPLCWECQTSNLLGFVTPDEISNMETGADVH